MKYNTTQEKEENMDFHSNIPDLRVITGGKSGGGSDWLMGLNIGTVFLTRPKKANPQTGGLSTGLQQYHVVHKLNKSVMLLDNMNKNDQYFWVVSGKFSDEMELFEVIHNGTEHSDRAD